MFPESHVTDLRRTIVLFLKFYKHNTLIGNTVCDTVLQICQLRMNASSRTQAAEHSGNIKTEDGGKRIKSITSSSNLDRKNYKADLGKLRQQVEPI